MQYKLESLSEVQAFRMVPNTCCPAFLGLTAGALALAAGADFFPLGCKTTFPWPCIRNAGMALFEPGLRVTLWQGLPPLACMLL